jgi:hypothetical protein
VKLAEQLVEKALGIFRVSVGPNKKRDLAAQLLGDDVDGGGLDATLVRYKLHTVVDVGKAAHAFDGPVRAAAIDDEDQAIIRELRQQPLHASSYAALFVEGWNNHSHFLHVTAGISVTRSV